MAQQSNVLLITADQWRGDCLSALDHPTIKTPALDALAGDGVLFRQHFAQCVPCGPSRASLFTGMYLMNHRSVGNGTPLDARFTNLALELRRGGYDPALIGYTDTSLDPRQHHANDPVLTTYASVLPGFRQLVPGSEHMPAWLGHLRRQGHTIPTPAKNIYRPITNDPTASGRGPTYPPACYRAEDSDTAFLTDRALDFIGAPDHAPWCLHLSLLRPHPPFVATAPYNALYHPDDVPSFRRAPSPADEAAQHPYTGYALRHFCQFEGLEPALHPPEEAAARQLRATYYGLITEVDHHVGRLIARLKETGQYDDTLILFASDHGEQLWDHWLLGKRGYFDQSFRVPLIVRAPGATARGARVDRFTETIDLMPTILDCLGLPIPEQCDGASLRPFLNGESPEGWRSEVHFELDFRDPEHRRPQTELGLRTDQCSLAVVRDQRFKYIHFAALPPLLFDLQDDPDELHNLARDPAHAALVLDYAQKMLSWRMSHADRGLTGIRLGPGGPAVAT